MEMKELGVSNLKKLFGFQQSNEIPMFADFSIDLCMFKDIAHKKIAVLFQIH